jgi:pimeloyl-ACP methyl ester carboxylesterase
MMKQILSYKGTQQLSYAAFGNPQGFPILVQHGLIASIEDGGLFQRLIDCGARVISIARPGYGESSAYEMKDMAEWAELVRAVVGGLGLAQFDVLGISSGAPYSYAIGNGFPGQARNLYILSGTPALFDAAVLAHWPYPVTPDASIADLQQLAHDLFFAHLSPEDRQSPDIRDSMNNGAFGIAQDFRLRCRGWGFALAAVTQPVFMRHSRADGSVPLVTAELTARQLANCTLEVREADDHFSPAILDDFLRTVVAARLPFV